ncbi:MAG: Holliday junction ATP-dependent DNA helicase RuvA [candidate division BRC1 bacterium ADurb.BinA364]|nr:MAG: Holliday junction ATP-dependent DNA helicase RuvA [candidate division BRC1 bacterium ADurb.BinA364]
MIERLRGELIEKTPRHAVVMAGGVGYGMDIPLSTYEALPREGEAADLFVHTHVREDMLLLFGFASAEEREAFLLLQGASGVGPAAALSVLSAMSLGALGRALAEGDADALTRVKGIGKRTAERIVLDLKNKTKHLPWVAAAAMAAENVPLRHEARDAVAALVNLGMKEPQAEKAVAAAAAALPPSATVEQLVVEGLKRRN